MLKGIKIRQKASRQIANISIILVFTLLTRLLFLNKFPIGITHDELNYVIAAKSLLYTGNFAPGTAPSILPTKMSNYTVTIAEIPSIILSITTGFLPLSLFNARVIGALFNILTSLGIYFLVKKIADKNTALISIILFALNPWSFLMGRSTFEVNFYLAFLIWGLVVLLNNKGWEIFYSLPLFILGFTSYIGGQISFLLFIYISLFYHHLLRANKKNKIIYLTYFTSITIFFICYTYFILNNQTFVARGKEIESPFSQRIVDLVEYERKVSLGKNKEIFINKATIYLDLATKKYLNAFSTNTLFTQGETRAAFSFQKHGTFYIIDFILIILGISQLFGISKRKFALILGIILISPITSTLSSIELSYSQRAGLMFPFLIILSAYGVNYLRIILSRSNTGKLLGAIFVLIYIISFANLMFLYFFRFPLYASDGWFFQDRLLSKYLNLVKEKETNHKIFIITPEPKIIFEEYLFFNNIYEKGEIIKINKSLDKKDYIYNGITFIEHCPTDIEKDATYILFYGKECRKIKETTKNPVRIANIRDNQELYTIFNDAICQGLSLNEYAIPQNHQDLNIEKMGKDEFCKKWITRNR